VEMKRLGALAATAALALAACNTASSPSPSSAGAPTAAATEAASAAASAGASPTEAALAPDPAEAVIPNVEQGAEIHFWTFYLSPTFDDYIKTTINRFEATYPGVKVDWEDHQATFQDDLKAAFAAGTAPDVINLSVSEGWVSDYASKGLLLGLNDKVPQAVQQTYFPGLWNEQLVNGQNYQFPWYQGINVDLINKQIFQTAGVDPSTFPKQLSGVPALCQTLLTAAKTPCDIRLTVNDILSQMVYEGNVKILTADGTKFAFNGPEAVAWVQMYKDMVKAGTVDTDVLTTTDDRVGLLSFSAGQAPFYATGLNLIRDVKANNSQLYSNLAVAPTPVGASGVVGKGLMSISVKADTKYPNASMALAQFFTNARSMTAFAKIVAIYPSTIASYDDPFFSSSSPLIEDSARATAKDVISHYADIVPSLPAGVDKGQVNDIVLKAVESAIIPDGSGNTVDIQTALNQAVAAANALIK